MKGENIIARRYAKALLDTCADIGEECLLRMHALLAELAGAILESRELGQSLQSPVISYQEKERLLTVIAAKFAPDMPQEDMRLLKNFCAVLAEKKRLPLFLQIARVFSDMFDKKQGLIRGSLLSAIELDAQKRSMVEERLAKSVDGKLFLNYQVDPTILGGLTLRLGNRVLDASLKTQLEILRDTIRKGE